jgi:hypothetical protein
MRIRRVVAIVLTGVLCLGAFGVVAAGAAKKKNTTVVVNLGPVLSGQKNVKVSGHLNTSSKCKATRAMKLFLTDAAGNVKGTLDGSTSDLNGNWRLKAVLPAAPTATDRLQVKANKRTVNKVVCKAGFSGLITIN